MLNSLKDLQELKVTAKDGELEDIYDVYFDDRQWHIRYFVLDVGSGPTDQQAVISANAVEQPDWNDNILPVALTLQEIEYSPEADAIKPVSEQEKYDSPLPPIGRLGGGLLSEEQVGVRPESIVETIRSQEDQEEQEEQEPPEEQSAQPHLRSAREVRGYNIQARDGGIGHVEDFIVQDESWDIQYLIVDTRNWLPGKKVLVSPSWVEMVDWDESKVLVDLSKQAIKDSPEYDTSTPLDRMHEEKLYDHYNLPKYWT